MFLLAQRPGTVAWPLQEPTATGGYVRNLLAQHLGYPLLVPEQPDNDPEECKLKGISIGDVGRLTSDGTFARFFNIYESVDGPSQGYVPDGFETLERGDVHSDEGHRFGKNSVIISKGPGQNLEGFAEFQQGKQKFFRYKPAAPEGAILFLPDGATSEDLKDPTALLPYIQKHALNWCKLITQKPLYLVTGRMMTSGLWAHACFSSPEGAPVRQGLPDIELSCAFMVGQDTEERKRYCRCMWECDRGASFRYGAGKFGSVETRNQCVFVRGYAISGRGPMGWNCALPEGLGLLEEDEEDEGNADEVESEWGDSVLIENIGHWPAPYHPSKDINCHLLNAHPEAQVAIAHDDEWCSVIEEGDITFPDSQELARRINVKYESTMGSGCVFLKPREKLAMDNNTQDGQ